MDTTGCNLTTKTCMPCEGRIRAPMQEEIESLLQDLSGWKQDGNQIVKTYLFKNYYETIAFVNATAWVSHHENHHPELDVGYRHCRVRYSTHALGDLSENDFICAAKIDALQTSSGA